MKKIYFLSVLLVCCLLFSCKDRGPTLNLVTSLDPLEAEEYIKAFEKDTGIKVRWIRLSAGEVLARFAAEKSRPTQTVWFGAPVFEFIEAKKLGYFEPYYPKEIEIIEPTWRDKEGYWTGVYLGTIAFAVNKDFLTKNNIEAPRTWNDLLKPEFSKKIALSLPYTAGTGYTILAGLISNMGEDKAFEYYKKLNDQIHHYTKSGSAPIVEAGIGEIGVGVAFSQDIVRKGSQRGFPIEVYYPEAVPYEIGGIALIKNGPSLEQGKKFIDWAISLPAQNLMKQWARIPIRKDAEKTLEVKGPGDVNVIDMDILALGENRTKYIERWRKEFGK